MSQSNSIIKKTYTTSNDNNKLIFNLYTKPNKDKSNIYNWEIYLDDNLILQYKKQKEYLDLWKHSLKEILNPTKVLRILIVGGGNQLLSNYLLRYPCNITIVDPACYLYLNTEIKPYLKTKDFINHIDPHDLELRRLVLLDMSLTEAYEDGCFEDGEFDLILADNGFDSLYHKTGCYDKEVPKIYFNLLKDKGFLIINNKFVIKRITNKTTLENGEDIVNVIKKNNNYYNNYLSNLNNYLNEADFIYNNQNKISVYSKTYTGSIVDDEE